MTVTCLLNSKCQVVAIYARREDAEARCDKYNADPFVAGDAPDPDAPYSTEEWIILEGGQR